MNTFEQVYRKLIAEANETPVPKKLYKWEITFRMKDENGEWKGGNKRTVIAPTQICAILKFKDLFTDEENDRIDSNSLMVNKGLASEEEVEGWTWPQHQINNEDKDIENLDTNSVEDENKYINFSINVNLENAAFSDPESRDIEIIRILKKVIADIEDGKSLEHAWPIIDINGNSVGEVTYN